MKGHFVRERQALFYADKTDELIRRGALRIMRRVLARLSDRAWVRELSDDRERAPRAPSREAQPASADSKRLTVRDLSLGPVEFFRSTLLREPSFEAVLVLYRRRAQWDTDDATLNPRNLFIRHYRRVPVADLALLMPDKRPAMRAVDRLTVASYGLTATLAAIPLLSFSVEPGSWTWILAASTFTAALSKVLFRYRFTKSYYHEAVNSHAARNSANADAGVLSFLIEQAVEQQLKRACSLYTALLLSQPPPPDCEGGPTASGGGGGSDRGLSAAELQRAVSALLAAEAETPREAAFYAQPWPRTTADVATALDTLAPLGLWRPLAGRLVRDRAAGERRWEPAPLPAARESIHECWSTLLEGPPAADCSWPWSAELGGGSTSRTEGGGASEGDTEGGGGDGRAPSWGRGVIFGLAPNLRRHVLE